MVRLRFHFTQNLLLRKKGLKSIWNLHASITLSSKTLGEAIGNEPEDYLALIMRMPDILKSERPELSEEEWAVATQVIQGALEALNAFRDQEGAHLEKDLRQRINNIVSLRKEVKSFSAERSEAVRKRLIEGMDQLKDRDQIDENRFEQELIYYLEKLDITEELVRLEGTLFLFS